MDAHVAGEVITRLNVIIALLLEQTSPEGKTSVSAKIHRLHDLGLTPAAVGAILGKKPNYVSAVLSSKKSAKEKGSG